MTAADMAHLPAPVFEGSEKRLEVDFIPLQAATSPAGLRELARSQLDHLMELAACCIVSHRSNVHFDAYVLSESSLFVYPTKFVLKTCGTTKLLNSVHHLLELAATIGLAPRRCKYSRASFLYPQHQPEPHGSFEQETAVLREHFGHLGSGGSAYILGDALSGLQWHVYTADADAAPTTALEAGGQPHYSLEICMTGLDSGKARQFFQGEDFESSAKVTVSSGIQGLLPGASIDDYVFEPCGYSMNGMEGEAFSTIHITPEDGFSYASVELSGYEARGIDVSGVVAKAIAIFEPASVSVALTADMNLAYCNWGAQLHCPANYRSESASCQAFSCGGRTAYYTLKRAKVVEEPGSPRAILSPVPSFFSLAASTESTCSTYEGDSSDERSAAGDETPALAAATVHEHPSRDMIEVLGRYAAQPLDSGCATALDAYAQCLIEGHSLDDTFYIVDLGAVERLYEAWVEAMPSVTPFYAVKCNTDPAILSCLAALGAGFDCASEAEIGAVLRLGVSPERIVFANPCKRLRDIRSAAATGVDLTTFDTVGEVAKLARWHPGTAALLRIRADDVEARCQLGNKFGAEPEDYAALLEAAFAAGLDVAGVSFHVGSGATNPAAFQTAIAMARGVFDQGMAMGFSMRILDLGGGFSGGAFRADGRVDLGAVPAAVNAALGLYFPPTSSVRIIAEPGRYFAEASATLACQVYGTRERSVGCTKPGFDYWITDGLYGSMNCVLYDHAVLSARVLNKPTDLAKLHSSTVFGPTCDGLDVVLHDTELPRMDDGDWMIFPNMGAYTISGASNFNGVMATNVKHFYVYSKQSGICV